ncbi:Multiple myeloma tumor-associated protein 2 [Tetrabaena socialis]|uniref:Multiple myeloma tumor-associated protein 2 n=1 Tax=Tetrabaena socialis TaxID=47790 RepID=A0A2J7ZN49_9CHLO|nr:Multiple myeloma tumor-associated protein 2 [Tetrabaena socialis]|eukprot:PNH01702.1 Multiple myeloma tumor-associated protein 2 [Tetrabaena socialis]
MSLYNGPPRPGARGGADQFSWDNVKADKDREYYLGHSVKALAGRWQKGKDVYWYTRNKGEADGLQDELRAVKQREEELMLERAQQRPRHALRWFGRGRKTEAAKDVFVGKGANTDAPPSPVWEALSERGRALGFCTAHRRLYEQVEPPAAASLHDELGHGLGQARTRRPGS